MKRECDIKKGDNPFYDLWAHLSSEHGLILLDSEVWEIVRLANLVDTYDDIVKKEVPALSLQLVPKLEYRVKGKVVGKKKFKKAVRAYNKK